MLEFSLPGGGMWGITLTGFLYALRERKLMPEIISGVSSGNHAGYLAFSNGDFEKALSWFKTSGDFIKSRPLTRFLPPYDMKGEYIGNFTLPFMVDKSVLTKNGLKHFYVGYLRAKNFQFVAEDILNYEIEQAFKTILKASSIPFLTNFVPHFEGGIDSGFKSNNFHAPVAADERWLITYGAGMRNSYDKKIWSRRIILPRPQGNPFFVKDQVLRDNFHLGYDFGANLLGI